ncbi:HD domain-containing protein [Actinoalloteichus hymeniacidonis]|uniref:HD domain-containing protein n=1 Tax=Actinoalloteichus hymeniacidonis TaxID=340345 RepID=A0AAC9MWJ4_9PSEU|nr:HD domain-containing protein [Actinoalloteichus hymeniacidonis]AOS61154.1 HD domain-containing protein [Actinoalloteichus hymeniacidonis]MBB5910845.1 hypothetical protein [Actinoalloteichus hymeniacidonis]
MRSESWAYELACERLSVSLPQRWAHVEAVARRAGTASVVVGDGAGVLWTAAVLHDVGYAPELAATGLHSLDGARFLRGLGVDERVVGLVAFHSAARWDAELAGLASSLGEFVDEGPTVVRDALWWADMTVGPDGAVVGFEERMAEVRRRYGPDHAVSRAVNASLSERAEAVNRTESRLRAAGVQV